ncbi:MAG: T9SS type A sorting domain-containing protein [Bacteroidales bacterium]|jgi:hypothetical protein|nr:T9SS type A sorting domain-containing protein [Bacteroidales bacterium]
MKKTIFLFLLLLNQVITINAQEWIRYYGDGYWSQNVIECYDKGYLITGIRLDGKYSCIIKTDINGNLLWEKRIGNDQYLIFAENIEQTPDNGFIIGGTTTKINNRQDPFILKLNSCGEVEWCKIVYTPLVGDDLGMMVKPTFDGGYLLLGLLNDPSQQRRVSLYRMDHNGELVWHYFYPPDSLMVNENAYELNVDEDGYLITGDGYYPEPGHTGGGYLRPYYIKTDTAGNELWKLPFGVDTGYIGILGKTTISPHGDYYSVGPDYLTDIPALIKVFHSGFPSCYHDIGNITGGAVSANFLNDTTLIILAGWSVGPTTHIIMYKTDTLANIKATADFPDFVSNYFDNTKTFDDKFINIATIDQSSSIQILAFKVNSDLEYDTLYNHPFVYDSLCPYAIVSDTIDLDCGLIVNVEEPFENPRSQQLKIFPNPAGDKITVSLPAYLLKNTMTGGPASGTVYYQWKSTTLEIYDLSGKKMFSKVIPFAEKELEIDVSKWPQGMYAVRLVFNGQTVNSGTFITK